MPRRTQQLKIFSAQAVITASCGRRMVMTIEQDAKDRETAKRRFARYKRLWIGDTRWQVRVDLRSVRSVKTPGRCLALLSQQLNAEKEAAANSFSSTKGGINANT